MSNQHSIISEDKMLTKRKRKEKRENYPQKKVTQTYQSIWSLSQVSTAWVVYMNLFVLEQHSWFTRNEKSANRKKKKKSNVNCTFQCVWEPNWKLEIGIVSL